MVEPLGGKHITRVTPDRSGAQFAKTLMLIARRYPTAKTLHLVMDNLNSHTLASVTRHYGETLGRILWSRFAVHYTPKHGSWLNQAEMELSILNRQCMGRRRFESIAMLDPHVRQWNRRVNRERLRFRWGFTTTEARTTFRYAPRADRNQVA